MSVGEAASPSAITRRRTPLSGEALLAFVMELVLRRQKPMQIAKKASIPYPIAAQLYEECFERAWGKVPFSPEVVVTMKAELTETLQEEVLYCRQAVRRSAKDANGNPVAPNTRHYTPMNTAIKQLSLMHGLNAPTQIETTDRTLYSLVNPVVYAKVKKNPEALAHLIALEEFTSALTQGLVIDGDEAVEIEGGVG